MLCPDDLVVNGEATEVKYKFDKWREGMEERGWKIEMGKNKYIVTR